LSVVALETSKVTRSELFAIEIPAAFVTVPPIVTVVKLPLPDVLVPITILSVVPSISTVSRSPCPSRVTSGPSLSVVVKLGLRTPVMSTDTKSFPEIVTVTLSETKFNTSSLIVTAPSYPFVVKVPTSETFNV